MSTVQAASTSKSSWAPLSEPLFRTLWIAALIADTGIWTHDMAASWLMTSSTSSPVLISLMQGAGNLPYFLLAFPAGVLADTFNHRTMLVITAFFIAAVSLVMAILAHNVTIHPWMLLTYVFAIGAGNAFYDPVWKGVVPQLVKPEMQSAAFGLDGVSVNLARAVGPAVAGFLISLYSPSAALLFNSVAFCLLAFLLMRWQPVEKKKKVLTATSFFSSIRTGLQFARYSPPVLRILMRSFLFLFPASVMWALLPLVGRTMMGLTAGQYGLLVGSVGIGAITAVTFMGQLKSFLGVEKTLFAGSIVFALNLLCLGYFQVFSLLCFTMILAGAGWILILSSLQASILPVTPQWVRGRVIALYSLTFFGSVSVGSISWGLIADSFGISVAFAIAMIVLIVTSIIGLMCPLPVASAISAEEEKRIEQSTVSLNPNLELAVEGPVVISLDYRVSKENQAAFLAKMMEVGHVRMKNGGYQWTIFEDILNPNIQKEQFIVSSRLEYMEQNERLTTQDKALMREVVGLTMDNIEPSQRYFRLSNMI